MGFQILASLKLVNRAHELPWSWYKIPCRLTRFVNHNGTQWYLFSHRSNTASQYQYKHNMEHNKLYCIGAVLGVKQKRHCSIPTVETWHWTITFFFNIICYTVQFQYKHKTVHHRPVQLLYWQAILCASVFRLDQIWIQCCMFLICISTVPNFYYTPVYICS